VTHDAPGHGASGFGMTSMPEFARALRAVDDAVGPAFGIVAHSMGASASTLAMAQGLTVSRAVFLAPAANPAAYVAPFAEDLGTQAGSGATPSGTESASRRLQLGRSRCPVHGARTRRATARRSTTTTIG
jgi:pimeloyl-ACP methyl ester carboxylesterase